MEFLKDVGKAPSKKHKLCRKNLTKDFEPENVEWALKMKYRVTHGHCIGAHKFGCTKEYRAWESMKTRCYNKRFKFYDYYGGRGIQVCDEWRDDFQAFFDYIGEAPSPDHSIDRIDNNGNYEPGNVRWALDYDQMNNRGAYNVPIKFRGRTMNKNQWCKELGISGGALDRRLKKGWSMEKALSTPVKPRGWNIAKNRPSGIKITYNGATKSISEWSNFTGINIHTIRGRLRRGWSIDKTLGKPARKKRKA